MAALLLLIDWTVKATALLLAAGVVVWLQRRASAAARHLTWTLALAGLLILPATTLVPSWRVPVAWSWLTPELAPATPLPAAPQFALQTELPAPAVLLRCDEAVTMARVRPEEMRERLQAIMAVQGPPRLPAPVETPAVALPADFSLRLFAFWAIGAGTFGAVLVMGCVRLRRLRNESLACDDAAIASLVNEAAAQLGIRRTIRIIQGQARQIPMTWGLFRPVVLLPDDVATWPDGRLRMVLLHELGHIRRWDCLTQFIALAARALWWFHPLAWFAAARQRAEQENACDDLVLAHGGRAEDYAEHLLAITAGLPADFFAAALALGATRCQRIQRRLVALLDATRNRRPLSRTRRFAACLVALLVIVPIGSAAWLNGAIQEQQAEQEQPKQPAPTAVATIKKLQEVHQKLRDHYVAPLDDKELLDAAIKGLLGGLKDPYTDLMPAENLGLFEAQASGAMTGIGAQLKIINERIAVLTPLDNSPALKAGVRPGDVIEAIDGQATQGLTLADAVKRIIGPAGTIVKLKVAHPDGVVEDLTITRGAIRLSSVQGVQRGPDTAWQFLIDPEHKIGYAQVLQFSKTTAAELTAALDALAKAGMKGMILDLRFCPGGLLDQGLKTADLFLDKGTLLTVKGAGKQENVYSAKEGDSPIGDIPLVLLINDQTASAAEIVAGALRDHKRAILVGSRTFGKGSVQTIVKLDDGAALKVTTAYHYLPSGRNIQKRPGEKTWGVDPTEGDYVPLTGKQHQALQAAMMDRAKIGFRKDERPVRAERVTPKVAEEQFADPQLAAALRTLIAKLTGGEFIRVGQPNALLQDHLQKLEEMQDRRAAILKNLQQLERDIEEVRKHADEKK